MSLVRYRLMLFVVLSFLLIVPTFQVQSAPLTAHGDSVFGINSHLGSRYPSYQTIDKPLAVLEQTGTGWVREEFQLSLIDREGNGTYDWGYLDKVVGDLASRGINIIGLINDEPLTGTPDTQRFVQFASTAASRFKGQIQYWEIWNEPENPLYWSPTSPANYARFLQAVSAAIKGVNPNAKILMSGIVPTHTDFLRGVAENGGWGAFDIVALHPYVDPWSPESGQIGVGGDVSKMKAIIEQFGAKPIWATEFGWSTGPADRIGDRGTPVDPETQANYMVRGAALLRVAGMERILWYNFKDTAERNLYGVISYDPSIDNYTLAKPSLAAFTTLNEQLAGTTPQTSLQPGASQVVLDFEESMTWTSGQGKGSLSHSGAQKHSGSSSGALQYNFTNHDNDFEGFSPPNDIDIPGSPQQLGVWVYGNGSGHEFKAWIRDSQGEILQFRLGVVGTGGWRFVSTPITQQVEDWNCIQNCGNLRLDFPVKLHAFILDDNPDTETGSGTFYIDDVTAMGSSYGVRFNKGSDVVDVLWSINGEQVTIPTRSSTGTLVDRSGNSQTVNASGGNFVLSLGPSPVYLSHTPDGMPGNKPDPTPVTPEPQPEPTSGPITNPTPVPNIPDGEECFDATGYCMSGRIREYWHQNGGLPVFGYPIGPQKPEVIEGTTYQVQWFERNRLELHPENAAPYDVLLGRLSEELLVQQRRVWQNAPKSNPQPGCRYFEETGFNVCGDILAAWRASGLELDGVAGKTEGENMALFGLPLGDAAMETIEGNQYLVQWFERARFEVHPENAPPYNVLFGLLGNEMMEGSR